MMITTYQLLGLLTVHFIGDFVLQSDWMAINKSRRLDALTVHVLTYTAFLSLVLWNIVPTWTRNEYAAFVLLTGACHFVQDSITSRISSKLYANHRHYFFVCIGFDQLLHYATFVLTAWVVMR